jgi:hypothetical protein
MDALRTPDGDTQSRIYLENRRVALSFVIATT